MSADTAARDEIHQLKKRVAELEGRMSGCFAFIVLVIVIWILSNDLNDKIGRLNVRIEAVEKAQERHEHLLNTLAPPIPKLPDGPKAGK